MTAVKTYSSIIFSRKFNSAQVLSKHPNKVLQSPGEFAGLGVSNGSAGQGTLLAAPHTPCRLLATAPAPQADSFLLCATEFPCSWQLPALLPGRHSLQAGSPHRGSPMAALPAGPSCPPSPPVSCCPLLHSGHKLLLLLLFVPGLNLLGLPPAQGFTASPAWTAHMSSRLPTAAPAAPACLQVLPCHVLTSGGAGAACCPLLLLP